MSQRTKRASCYSFLFGILFGVMGLVTAQELKGYFGFTVKIDADGFFGPNRFPTPIAIKAIRVAMMIINAMADKPQSYRPLQANTM